MSDVSFDDLPDPVLALQADDRRLDTRLLKAGGWTLGVLLLLTVLAVPAANQPLMDMIGSLFALLQAQSGELISMLAAWAGTAVGSVVYWVIWVLVTGVIWTATTMWQIANFIYELAAAYYPLALAHALGEHGDIYRATAVPIVIATLPAYALVAGGFYWWLTGPRLTLPSAEGWFNMALLPIIALVLALGTDICTFWLYHMQILLNAKVLPPGATFMTGVISFFIVVGAFMFWSSHIQHQHRMLAHLKWEADEPGWIIPVRSLTCLATPVVLMAGAYALTYVVHNNAIWAVGVLGAGLLEAVALRLTIGFGLSRRSTFTVKRETAADFQRQDKTLLLDHDE